MNVSQKKAAETIVLSVGGSLVVPSGGIDVDFLKKFDVFIRKQVKEKNRRFIIVIGGGRTARQYRDAGKDAVGKITDEDLDWIGIHATRLNAHLLRTIFQDISHPRIIENYERRLINWKEPIAFGAGWKPGWSTDYCSVIVARDYKASFIVNLSNIDYAYDKDPAKFPDAKKIKRTTWDHFEKLVPKKWVPGTNAPFDPIASQLAKQNGTMVIIANGSNFNNLGKILNGEPFKGTIVSNFQPNASFYDKDYFESRQGQYRIPFSESAFGSFLQDLRNIYRALWIRIFINPKNCLDVGCGTGRLVGYLRKLGIEAYGIDISDYAIDNADKEVKPFLKKGDAINIPYDDNIFDLVVSVDLLEHVERSYLKKAVSESIRVSKKFVMHKIYTIENVWVGLTHSKDNTHISVLSQAFWYNLFRSLDSVSIVQKFVFKLPTFFESVFLVRKKSSQSA